MLPSLLAGDSHMPPFLHGKCLQWLHLSHYCMLSGGLGRGHITISSVHVSAGQGGLKEQRLKNLTQESHLFLIWMLKF